jgi:hypothetical protein
MYLKSTVFWLLVVVALGTVLALSQPLLKRSHITVRGIYGGAPEELLSGEGGLASYGVNAIFLGSGSLTGERVSRVKSQGARIFAEFNSMHYDAYLADHPDAYPVGTDGRPAPAPEGWQGVCPTHPGYRENRMRAFRQALRDFDIDGIWLDYHHSHANWERAEPILPDTCFCNRCLAQFQAETGTELASAPVSELAALLLSQYRPVWVAWRCDVFTDWVREYRSVLDETRPGALLGTFHCPWKPGDFGNALREKLAIDLESQAPYLDVLSPMPYHARFGHAGDPGWISRQVADLGQRMRLKGTPGERPLLWPIVQLSDWGEAVPAEQVETVLDHGSRLPATGVMVFNWGSMRHQGDKIEALGRFYRAIAP